MNVAAPDVNQVANDALQNARARDMGFEYRQTHALVSIAASLRLISLSLFNIAKNTRPEEDYTR